jgi:acyl-CoA thioester hydrolase
MMRKRENNGPYNIWAETETTVEFFDCDPMRVVWHGNYIKYFEIGRRALLGKMNYDYDEMEKSGYAFPVIEISAKYLGPLLFKDRVRIKAILLEYENRLKIEYEIYNAATGRLTTKGFSSQMAIDMRIQDSCFVSPKILFDKVEALIGGKES